MGKQILHFAYPMYTSTGIQCATLRMTRLGERELGFWGEMWIQNEGRPPKRTPFCHWPIGRLLVGVGRTRLLFYRCLGGREACRQEAEG